MHKTLEARRPRIVAAPSTLKGPCRYAWP